MNQIGLMKKKYMSQLAPNFSSPNTIEENVYQEQEMYVSKKEFGQTPPSNIGSKTGKGSSMDRDEGQEGEEGDPLDYDNKVGLFASDVRLNSERSEKEPLTNIKLGSHAELEIYKESRDESQQK